MDDALAIEQFDTRAPSVEYIGVANDPCQILTLVSSFFTQVNCATGAVPPNTVSDRIQDVVDVVEFTSS
jgi:hypothetical protein